MTTWLTLRARQERAKGNEASLSNAMLGAVSTKQCLSTFPKTAFGGHHGRWLSSPVILLQLQLLTFHRLLHLFNPNSKKIVYVNKPLDTEIKTNSNLSDQTILKDNDCREV